MSAKKPCPNFNHNRSHITINYCPQCGGKFHSAQMGSCDEEKHRVRRKERHNFCIDCGKNLKSETK